MGRFAWLAVVLVAGCGDAGDDARGCPPLTIDRGGACLPYGVAACAEGFTADAAGGCAPILPDGDCPPATFATPGDRACRPIGIDACADGFALEDGACVPAIPESCGPFERASLEAKACVPIAACGASKYPTSTAPAIHVDQAYAGGGSDGSAERPFTDLGAALAAVDATRKTILVTDGKYVLGARVDREVEIVGRCSERVSIHQSALTTPTITVAADVTLRAVTITGAAVGVHVERGTARIVQSRISNTGGNGVQARSPGRLELDRCLVLGATANGVLVDGAAAVITDSEVRGAKLDAAGQGGTGLGVIRLGSSSGDVEVRRSVISDSDQYGALARGSRLAIDGSLVRRTGVARKTNGAGIYADTLGAPSHLTVTRSVVSGTVATALGAFDGTAVLDRVVITGNTVVTGGAALQLGFDPVTRKPVTAKIERTVVQKSQSDGVLVFGANAEISGLLVRDIAAGKGKQTGVGVRVATLPGRRVGSSVVARDVSIERVTSDGIAVSAGEALFERVAVRDVAPDPSTDTFGLGLVAFVGNEPSLRPNVTLRSAVIERVHDVGAASFGAQLTLEGVLVRDVRQRAGVTYGHGLHFTPDYASGLAAEALVRGCVVVGAFEAGVNVYKSSATIEDTTILDTRAGAAEMQFGDGVTVAGITPAEVKLGVLWAPARVVLRRSRIHGSARAALSVFEAEAEAAGVVATCNGFDIDVEVVDRPDPQPFTLVDGGGNACGCGALSTCRASSSNLAPVGAP
ncbi:MAG: right-handed parallel beta-helix repeat-containing protein [Deltaproteobacteria bacterium]|nr:right-handed parallel beta-helix repeat-containing protein [Deltaproteobacteria bacterium]